MNPAPRMSPVFWILLLALGSLASTGCSRHPHPPGAARQAAPRSGGTYAAARHGGGYMHNYYLPPAPSSAPWAPAWSPDGRQIAVGLQGSIWRIELAGREAFELTYDGHYHSSPDWSPDGKWIVYPGYLTRGRKHRFSESGKILLAKELTRFLKENRCPHSVTPNPWSLNPTAAVA